MSASRIFSFSFAPAVLALAFAAVPAHAAGITQLTSASQLASTDNVAVYPDTPNLTNGPIAVNSPYTVTAGANTLTFSDNGGFQVDSTDNGFVNENPLTNALIFPQGTSLLDNQPFAGGSYPVNGPDTIDFAMPVSEFGVEAFSEDDAQNFDVNVFDGATSLGTFSVINDLAGENDPTYQYTNADFAPVFLGASAPSEEITSIVISSPNTNGAGFVLGPMSSTAVPEPSAFALTAFGLALLPLAVRRRRTA
jgi:hypothetical protein